MNAKLTLTIEEEIISKAKLFAKSKGQSLSAVIENYLKVIVDKEIEGKAIKTPIVKSLRGSFKAPKDFDYKKELTKKLSDKYL